MPVYLVPGQPNTRVQSLSRILPRIDDIAHPAKPAKIKPGYSFLRRAEMFLKAGVARTLTYQATLTHLKPH